MAVDQSQLHYVFALTVASQRDLVDEANAQQWLSLTVGGGRIKDRHWIGFRYCRDVRGCLSDTSALQ